MTYPPDPLSGLKSYPVWQEDPHPVSPKSPRIFGETGLDGAGFAGASFSMLNECAKFGYRCLTHFRVSNMGEVKGGVFFDW